MYLIEFLLIAKKKINNMKFFEYNRMPLNWNWSELVFEQTVLHHVIDLIKKNTYKFNIKFTLAYLRLHTIQIDPPRRKLSNESKITSKFLHPSLA
jgi:hypothetical protein